MACSVWSDQGLPQLIRMQSRKRPAAQQRNPGRIAARRASSPVDTEVFALSRLTRLVALVAPGILAAGPAWGWLAAAVTAGCAVFTRNVLLAMVLGITILAAQRNLL